MRWHEVADFYGSGPRSRHYVLDHLTGEMRFGDGLNGLIPPAGIGNIRLGALSNRRGKAGNRPAGTIVQLKTTVPYVDKVTNTEAAAGGADAETLDSLLERAPRTLRHGNRAVTVEDYEDLAMSGLAGSGTGALRSFTQSGSKIRSARSRRSVAKSASSSCRAHAKPNRSRAWSYSAECKITWRHTACQRRTSRSSGRSTSASR